MDKNRMFGGLDEFRKKGYFKKHKTGWLYYEKAGTRFRFLLSLKVMPMIRFYTDRGSNEMTSI